MYRPVDPCQAVHAQSNSQIPLFEFLFRLDFTQFGLLLILKFKNVISMTLKKVLVIKVAYQLREYIRALFC